MRGLELCARYFQEIGAPMLKERFPKQVERIAAGLVGEGSECFGFDDEVSRDHDWGPAFCLWLTAEDHTAIANELQHAFAELPKTYADIEARQTSHWGRGRTGVFEIGFFYKRFIGLDHPPDNLMAWRLIPEAQLAAATNGQVFCDPLGDFSAFRQSLLTFYPEDIRLKLIALRCMIMAQAGQYNFTRCIRRQEVVAAHRAEAQFIDATVSLVFLLNRRYKPFFKWMHRALKDLPLIGPAIFRLTAELVTCHERHFGVALSRQKAHLMERICGRVAETLRDQGISAARSDDLLEHGPQVQARIRDSNIRALDIWAP